MQSFNWNDLKYLIALHRSETLRAAARHLGTSDTTVARRIADLQDKLGVTLFLRDSAGRYVLTEIGHAVLIHAETTERAAIAVEDLLGQITTRLTGVVRISSVPVIINRILVPQIGRLQDQEPGLTLELVPEARLLDLNKREADLALRFARPAAGGLRVKAQKLGRVTFDLFASSALAESALPETPWIDYEDAHASLPQARWLANAAQRDPAGPAPLKVADLETAWEAAAQGLGKTLLPGAVAAADTRLQRVDVRHQTTTPAREVWLLSHADQSDRASVLAVKNWLNGLRWS
ncbi:LysR family transcriptional regulator [uncultured Roseobacter sp.]|uniref:LysR family transcriptional regulator n=1 Tax=uncultured Roseobacter sp. TaxID=114847 RepID=UPI00261747F7|nr:LysR family transcriptional regulator [uncultured Roseobacter sp.]